jgi:hypothetical protein
LAKSVRCMTDGCSKVPLLTSSKSSSLVSWALGSISKAAGKGADVSSVTVCVCVDASTIAGVGSGINVIGAIDSSLPELMISAVTAPVFGVGSAASVRASKPVRKTKRIVCAEIDLILEAVNFNAKLFLVKEMEAFLRDTHTLDRDELIDYIMQLQSALDGANFEP